MKKNTFLFISILLIINALNGQIPNLEIWEIQGNGAFSPFLNQLVETPKNVVTAVGDDFFYIQTPSYRADNQIATSDGIRVQLNNTPTVEVGNMVTVIGTVREFFQRTQFDEDDPLTILLDSSAVDLPAPILLTENFPSPDVTDFSDMEKVEGMLVQFTEATTTAPTNNFGETSIKVGPDRSFREPGVQAPAPNGFLEWDGNPEVFEFNPNGLGLEDQPLLSGNIQISATGVIDYAFDDYLILPTEYEITGQPPLRAVDEATATQATIGNINLLELSDLENNYLIRREKVANYIVELMKAPDIVAVQEVRSLAVLQDVANLITSTYSTIQYTPYLLSNGSSGSFVINVGYLVKNTITDVQITQLGAEEQVSFGGDLHFRPPLLLEANFNTNPPTPISILNLHLKSLNGIENTTTKIRRHEQAISVAQMVEERINDNLVVVGDFNAFQFSDGYVDVVNQIAGTPSLGAEYPVQNIVTTPLTNQSLTVPDQEQYSFIFRGNAQILDHCLTADLQGLTVNKLQYVRANADNHPAYLNQLSPNLRTSDHDGFVLFLELENELMTTSLLSVTKHDFSVSHPNPFAAGDDVTIHLHRRDNLNLQLIKLDGKIIFEKKLGSLDSGVHRTTMPLQLEDGAYILKIEGAHTRHSGVLISLQ
ncbi:MAG: endonuclease/exonuclease/phosphatase family protein [Bacteroidota bacterium]